MSLYRSYFFANCLNGSQRGYPLKTRTAKYVCSCRRLNDEARGCTPIRKLLPEIDNIYEQLLHVCEDLQSSDIVPGTNWCKADVQREKSEFDVHAIAWISHNEYQMNVRGTKTLSVDGSYRSSSSVRSAKLKSRVKLKVTSTAMQ